MKNRILYIDTLKFIAIFSVVAIHGFAISHSQVLNIEISVFQQFFRFAVPIFLMITGALFLNKPIDLADFFKKRVVRIFYPFLFFSIIIFLVFNSNITTFYWYSLMILGTLFAIPIINKFIQNSSENEIIYYILIFIIFSICTQALDIFKINHAFDMTFFITPISYLVIGYYLFNKDIDYSHNKLLIISLVLFIITSILKMKFGTYVYSNQFHTHLDLSFLQIIQASSVFIFFKYLYSDNISIFILTKKILNNNLIKKIILSVSKSSYGMYLVQHLIIYNIIRPYYNQLSLTGTQSLLLCIIIIIGVFIISWITTVILSKIPVINKFSGYY